MPTEVAEARSPRFVMPTGVAEARSAEATQRRHLAYQDSSHVQQDGYAVGVSSVLGASASPAFTRLRYARRVPVGMTSKARKATERRHLA
jgi:hypothetical protein